MRMNLIDTFKFLPKTKRRKLFVILILLLIGIAFEGLSFAIFIPVLELLINNNLFFIEKFNINKILNIENLQTENVIFIFLLIIVCIFFLKNLYLIFLYWFKNKFFKELNSLNSIELFNNYLDLDWEKFIKKNSSEIIRNVQTEIQKITITINAFLELISEILVFLVILFFLLLWNPSIVLFLLFLFFIVGYLFIFIFKKKISFWAKQIQKHEAAFFKNIKEAIGSIKEIKILGKKKIFTDELYSRIIQAQACRLKFETIQQSPRFFFEFTSVLTISLITIYFIVLEYSSSQIIVNLGLIALALFRILPSTNRIVKNFNDIKFGMNSVRLIENEYSLFKNQINIKNEKVSFEKSIELKNINFSYGINEKSIFKNLNLNIKKNSVVGIIGESGSGKTTLIDILTGLILIKDGSLEMDNKKIDINNVKSYQENFGYVPQNFYLFDDTIRQNISIKRKTQNTDLIEENIMLDIIKKLKLNKIIQNKGLNTEVGENAVRLSGGQKQRLGIARILFHNKNILVLDESTNALDKETEKEIFDFIYSLKGKKTIIISTHSINMLQNCDQVFEIENKSLKKIN